MAGCWVDGKVAKMVWLTAARLVDWKVASKAAGRVQLMVAKRAASTAANWVAYSAAWWVDCWAA